MCAVEGDNRYLSYVMQIPERNESRERRKGRQPENKDGNDRDKEELLEKIKTNGSFHSVDNRVSSREEKRKADAKCKDCI